MNTSRTGAELVVACLEAHGVTHVFGIPGAKVDAIFNALEDSTIKLVVCRHEQNAAFMAAMVGRITGQPGVVLVTSGPGVSNLATGLLTATTEGDPVVALGANVARSMLLKESHQVTKNVALMEPVTKKAVELSAAENVAEAIGNAFRVASEPHGGACFVSFPTDILSEQTTAPVLAPRSLGTGGAAPLSEVVDAVRVIENASCPVLLLGAESSRPKNAHALIRLLEKTALPTLSTYQAAGVVPLRLGKLFAGRVGLFDNQPGDKLLEQADCVVTVGFHLAEYDPEIWNARNDKEIVHIDYRPSDLHTTYEPAHELLGDIATNIGVLTEASADSFAERNRETALVHHKALMEMINAPPASPPDAKPAEIHPLTFIRGLQGHIDEETTIVCDVGSVYMWMARYLLAHHPHHLLFSNGQQTLGVGLPWAIAAKLCRPEQRVISISGDGGFLFSAMELETAVREKVDFVHFVWRDGSYNMVAEQEIVKYGRTSGVDFGAVDLKHFAKAFGAKGYVLRKASDFESLLDEVFSQKGPVLVDIPIDYRDNPSLFRAVQSDLGH